MPQVADNLPPVAISFLTKQLMLPKKLGYSIHSVNVKWLVIYE